MNKNQAIIFFGIILAGLGISIFTLNIFGDKVEVTEEEKPVAAAPDKPAPAPETKPEPAPAPVPEPPAPEPTEAVFKSPEALVGALVDKIKARDVEGFMEIAGENAVSPAIRPQVEGLLKDPQWSPRADAPISELAKSADSVRWEIHLEKAADATATELYTDLSASEDKTSWHVAKVALPLDFAEKTGLAPASGSMKPGEPGAPGTPATPTTGLAGDSPGSVGSGAVDASDALTVAHAFSQAIVDRNFELARKLTDAERVTDERVAALMIAIEEGSFHLREDKPLIVTLSRDNLTWVLTRVDSATSDSEFAVEMGRAEPTAEWKIHGLTFSKLIASLADAAGAGGVAYAPIVADPQGGDSLVLYFEFDDEGVNARSARQLRIVADILRADPARKLHINGHADALGTDDYNEGLSNRRAAAIREQLIAFGVSGDQIVTKAFGEAMPRRPNFNPDGTDNPDNRSQNRRAEVYLDF
ncbi:MAG: OmpA family protein [Verrucomicrobiae bacterium]|nr:OmpA family protein [Verrucomicrobiae bacterium]